MNKTLEELTKEQLLELIGIYSKNLIAMDGVWFQSVEQECGMEEAMEHDCRVWERFSAIEARRIKALLRLPEHSGLEGLSRALPLRYNSAANRDEILLTERELVYRVVNCRVQEARARKKMGYHPCKPAGIVEYSVFAREIDSRIRCACLSCYPEATDGSCACAWRFTCDEGEERD